MEPAYFGLAYHSGINIRNQQAEIDSKGLVDLLCDSHSLQDFWAHQIASDMADETKKTVKVAVTQAEPVWLDLSKTVEKTCKLIAEAASHGAKIVTFPECWIPGYPAWIWYSSIPRSLKPFHY